MWSNEPRSETVEFAQHLKIEVEKFFKKEVENSSNFEFEYIGLVTTSKDEDMGLVFFPSRNPTDSVEQELLRLLTFKDMLMTTASGLDSEIAQLISNKLIKELKHDAGNGENQGAADAAAQQFENPTN